jgi:hypothetical protein
VSDEVRGLRAAMALKDARLGLRHRTQLGRADEAHGRTPRRHDATRGDIELRSLIAHGIGVGAIPSRACSFALTTATATLLLSVGFATRRASPIPPPDLGEVETSRLGGAAARAVLLVAVTGAADRKLGAAPSAPLETDSIDASATRAFALRGTAGLHDDFGVAGHVGHDGDDQSISTPMSSDPRERHRHR